MMLCNWKRDARANTAMKEEMPSRMHLPIVRILRFATNTYAPFTLFPTCLTTVKLKETSNTLFGIPRLVNHAPSPFLECLRPLYRPRSIIEALARCASLTRSQRSMPSLCTLCVLPHFKSPPFEHCCGEESIGRNRRGLVGKTRVGPLVPAWG